MSPSPWSWSKRSKPDDLDVFALLNDPVADADVAELIEWLWGAPRPPFLGPPLLLLRNDLLALLAWRKAPDLLCFDVGGRCVGVAPCGRWNATGWTLNGNSGDIGLEFSDRNKPAFALGTWSSQRTSLFGGRTAASVTFGDGTLLGTYDQRNGGQVKDAAGVVLGGSGPPRNDRGFAGGQLLDPRGELLAEYVAPRWRSKTRGGRKFGLVRVIRWPRHVSSTIRALTVAKLVADEVQAQKDLAYGD